jgi:hypothetical protein
MGLLYRARTVLKVAFWMYLQLPKLDKKDLLLKICSNKFICDL